MLRKFAVLSLAIVAGVLAACGGGHGSLPNSGMGGVSYALPQVDDLSVSATLPKHAIGEDLPELLGTTKWNNEKIGGFTQQKWSQKLAFPPGTTITIHNLSKTGTDHTFNVVMVITGKNFHFPQNPSLSFTAHGHGKLEAGYASGVIHAGQSKTVKLVKAGTYLVGCAFHYVSDGMRDILVVSNDPDPGPQASPPASGAPSPSPTSSGGGGGGGW